MNNSIEFDHDWKYNANSLQLPTLPVTLVPLWFQMQWDSKVQMYALLGRYQEAQELAK
jgi:hypothetical protein